MFAASFMASAEIAPVPPPVSDFEAAGVVAVAASDLEAGSLGPPEQATVKTKAATTETKNSRAHRVEFCRLITPPQFLGVISSRAFGALGYA
ncbi:MAG: hypothetical protein H6685_07575 [Deltaproteobacteria bacterium]|nr:hypothetical protein [Deltaproteobacteria bacterium]